MLADPNGSLVAPIASPVVPAPSLHWTSAEGLRSRPEEVITEAALSLEIAYSRGATLVVKTLGITMRTPGNDHELALGFLLGEGVIMGTTDVHSGIVSAQNSAGEKIETYRVVLTQPPRNDLLRVSRAVTTTSACGLCGRSTLEGLPMNGLSADPAHFQRVRCELISVLPEKLRAQQIAFAKTGGSHGAALSTRDGEIVLTREDVGRHNAVDKVVGGALLRRLPLPEFILVLSGRASFELVQKSASAGVPMIVAVGAPSSAAVELAAAAGITLIGFTRENRFNVYTHAVRVALN